MMKSCLLLSLALLLEPAFSVNGTVVKALVTVDQTTQLIFWAEQPGVKIQVKYKKPKTSFSFTVREEHKWTAIFFSDNSMQIPSYGCEIKFNKKSRMPREIVLIQSDARIHWKLCHSVGSCDLNPPAGFSVEPPARDSLNYSRCFLRSPLVFTSLVALCTFLGVVVLILALCNCRVRKKLTDALLELQEYGIYDDISHLSSNRTTAPALHQTSYFNALGRGGDNSLPPYTAHEDNPIFTEFPHYSNEVPNQTQSLQRQDPVYLNLQQ